MWIKLANIWIIFYSFQEFFHIHDLFHNLDPQGLVLIVKYAIAFQARRCVCLLRGGTPVGLLRDWACWTALGSWFSILEAGSFC